MYSPNRGTEKAGGSLEPYKKIEKKKEKEKNDWIEIERQKMIREPKF